jgi:hypothetical protein
MKVLSGKVLCINGSRFLKKGTWYTIIPTSKYNITNTYQLENHTDIPWNTSWYHKVNFITEQEWREQQLNKLL